MFPLGNMSTFVYSVGPYKNNASANIINRTLHNVIDDKINTQNISYLKPIYEIRKMTELEILEKNQRKINIF